MDKNFIGKRNALVVKKISSIVNSDWQLVESVGKVNKNFYDKYKKGTCGLYAAGSHLVQLINIANIFPAWAPFYQFMIKLVPFRNRKRIIFASAFNTIVDEVVDHSIKKNKKQKLKEIIYDKKKLIGNENVLRQISTKLISMGVDLNPFLEWAEMEERNMNGEEDSEGICFRSGGCEVATDLLNWAIKGDEKNRKLILEVAFLTQMIDDVIDKKEDAHLGIKTPAIIGKWTEKTVVERFTTLKKLVLPEIKNKRLKLLVDETINWYVYWLICEMEKSIDI
ncbi:MAG: hypothetical protein KKF65_03365 [Nanoarchaeota archaeon]|nr:hypothetical protein [Nanoarchaeota archaeon]